MAHNHRSFVIPAQSASDYCPEVPRTIRVVAPDRKSAVEKLAKVLKADPKLEKLHPELHGQEAQEAPAGEDKKPKASPKK